MTGTNTQLQLAEGYVQFTGRNIFLTGKAGTGKTTFLKHIKRTSSKRMVIVAPTGVAAINAGGVTIHSFFQLPFGPLVPGKATEAGAGGRQDGSRTRKFSKEKLKIIQSLDLLIIDEISMVRADLLDAIDETLRRLRNSRQPFGGLQLLMIGDLQQLAPVVKPDEKEILHEFYDTPFFFSSLALRKKGYITILLDKIYRQSDAVFIDILNKIRTNRVDRELIDKLNERHIPGFLEEEKEGYIILTTHNQQARDINSRRLEELKEKSRFLTGSVEGDFPEYAYPTDLELELKVGAQVMFIKNDLSPEKRYYNGKIGVVEEIDEDEIWIICEGEDNAICCERHEWENSKYSLNRESGEIEEQVVGRFVQFPLKHAWAITIHKSQGLTFERAIIDVSSAFAHGQVYVALSRCRTLEGLVLNSPVRPGVFINNTSVADFTETAEKNSPDLSALESEKKQYEKLLARELFDMSLVGSALQQLTRTLEKYSSGIVSGPLEQIRKVREEAERDLLSVSRKFTSRIDIGPDIGEGKVFSGELKERMVRAGGYFSEKLNHLLKEGVESSVETDNSEAEKKVNESLDYFIRRVQLKLFCLDACKKGFSVASYLEARAKAELEPQVKRKRKTAADDYPDRKMNSVLYAELVKWRAGIAGRDHLSHFMVVHIRTLLNIAKEEPHSLKELLKVKGMGKKTTEKYGREILDIIAEVTGSGINFDPIPEREKKAKKKKSDKPDTREISLEMFLGGMSPVEIAEERGLTPGTIESHLAKQVREGRLDIYKVIKKEDYDRIKEFFGSQGAGTLSDAKEHFGDDYSYNELRYVWSHMEFTASMQKEQPGKE